ncbi:hypothetical protein RhiirA4_473479 [Rhizophagus irregularis]|uniref:Uncharacterized protein n=1 Tax=Rhizophagus irregularis TaxID=588596 RepID=A0A2I1H6T2_9GLOM|nr:hypothetical protein RhiirA4_473479 [Rhizophagus irregularis]
MRNQSCDEYFFFEKFFNKTFINITFLPFFIWFIHDSGHVALWSSGHGIHGSATPWTDVKFVDGQFLRTLDINNEEYVEANKIRIKFIKYMDSMNNLTVERLPNFYYDE